MGEADDNLGVGGGTPPVNPLGGPSLEAEEKAMRKGKGRMVAAMVVAVLAAVGLITFFMVAGGESEAYSKLGRNVNGIKQAHFDSFWGCALRGEDISEITQAEALISQIDRRASQGGNRYVQHVRDECMPKLEELNPKLEGLLPPEDIKPHIADMKEANQALRSAWSNFIAYVEGAESYDSDEANQAITNIARGWYDFKRAFSALNDAVREKLNQ